MPPEDVVEPEEIDEPDTEEIDEPDNAVETDEPEEIDEAKKKSSEDIIKELQDQNEKLAKREKELLDERSQMGRRTKDTMLELDKITEKMNRYDRIIGKLDNEEEDTFDFSDAKNVSNFIDTRIENKLKAAESEQKNYSSEYEKTVYDLGKDLDPKEFKAVLNLLETEVKTPHIGKGKYDAMVNFNIAQAKYFKGLSSGGRKSITAKKNTIAGAGVEIPANNTKAVKKKTYTKEEQRLLAIMGKDDKWASSL